MQKLLAKMVEQCMSNQAVVRFWSLGLDKILPRVARVLKIIVWIGSGWPKRPRVGSIGRVLTRPIPRTKQTVRIQK